MNGSKENAAWGAFGQSGRREVFFDLTTARRMVPLVRHIVQEITDTQRHLDKLRYEQERLDHHRRDLAWPERSRRYQVREETTAGEQQLSQARAELEKLGVALVDADAAWVGFPTIVNGRAAFFSLKPGEEEVRYWHFAGETVRRLIPRSWLREEQESSAGKT
jgi:hypothetical protein